MSKTTSFTKKFILFSFILMLSVFIMQGRITAASLSGTCQAETATELYQCFVSNACPGYTGTGHVQGFGITGDYIYWKNNTNRPNVTKDGMYSLTIRYCKADADRNVKVVINSIEISTINLVKCPNWSTWQTATIQVPFIKGYNSVRLIANGGVGGGCNIDKIDYAFVSNAKLNIIQAENASSLNQCTVGNTITGFAGAGFVQSFSAKGDIIEWTNSNNMAYAPQEGFYKITFVYCKPDGNRDGHLYINGVSQAGVVMAQCSNWQDWRTVTVEVPLNQGFNAIKLYGYPYGGSGGAGCNIDYFKYEFVRAYRTNRYEGTFEAENQIIRGGIIGNTIPGFSGTGYVEIELGQSVFFDKKFYCTSEGFATLVYKYILIVDNPWGQCPAQAMSYSESGELQEWGEPYLYESTPPMAWRYCTNGSYMTPGSNSIDFYPIPYEYETIKIIIDQIYYHENPPLAPVLEFKNTPDQTSKNNVVTDNLKIGLLKNIINATQSKVINFVINTGVSQNRSIDLKICSIKGNTVKQIIVHNTAMNTIQWDISKEILPIGIYMYKLQISQNGKLINKYGTFIINK